jgi:hypothetical protein
LPKDTFMCPLCREKKRGEMFHCRDHCMDMCSDHVRKTSFGHFICQECEKVGVRESPKSKVQSLGTQFKTREPGIQNPESGQEHHCSLCH